jgi:hypothetical protein
MEVIQSNPASVLGSGVETRCGCNAWVLCQCYGAIMANFSSLESLQCSGWMTVADL